MGCVVILSTSHAHFLLISCEMGAAVRESEENVEKCLHLSKSFPSYFSFSLLTMLTKGI